MGLSTVSMSLDLLDEQNVLLLTLIENMAPVTSALGGTGGAELDAVVESTNALLTATADRAPELQATIAALPATISAARTALQELTTLSGSTTPALQALEPLSSNFESFSAELQAFTDVADPALASLQPVLEEGDTLLRSARPVVAQLRAAAPAAAADGEALRPILTEALGGIDHILNFLRNWALVTNGSDGVSHYFRAHIVANACVLGPLGLGLGNPLGGPCGEVPDDASVAAPAPVTLPGSSPSTASPSTNVLDNTLSGVEDLTNEVLDGLGNTLNSLTGSPSATGLNAQQERNIVSMLLGGGL